jgi:SAM-dependent methyltransferase
MANSSPKKASAHKKVTSLPFEISQEIKDGLALVGDDFSDKQLNTWFGQEQEAFYVGDAGNSEVDPWYAYMRYVNEILGFSNIKKSRDVNRSILILGPGSGTEIEHFTSYNPKWELNFIEASDNFKKELRKKFPSSNIINPEISGNIALASNTQDVVCAFSVLHHIPNVSKVISEVFRVTKPGGLFLVREPCSSMGDWRYGRSATPNERGISCHLLASIGQTAGFKLLSKPTPIIFEPINKIIKTIGLSFNDFNLLYKIDRLVSKIVSFNDHYWRDTWYKKIGPSSYFYVFSKIDAV